MTQLAIETAIFAAVAFIAWIVAHGLLHGALDPTWTGQELLIVVIVVGWLAVRYVRRRRARLRLRLPPR